MRVRPESLMTGFEEPGLLVRHGCGRSRRPPGRGAMQTELPFTIQSDDFYRNLGLRSGLEIHQQLRTERKLFCRCPTSRYVESWDAEILRHMRPTLSELGEYDGTALMEFRTRKEIVYQITRDTTCTYEMDDAPPFHLNEEALEIALEIALLLGCSIVGELHVARKQYLDGSIPTGFQRTTILGVEGRIPHGERTIGIQQLGLEEDSCRQIDDRGHVRTFRTDRLSRPLIESVTHPDMRTPREVAEVAEILRRLHRATGKVRTGIGAARQDVNVSIEGGTRVEIKGVPRIPDIPALVHVEVLRQRQLLWLKRAIRDRGLRLEDWRSRPVDLTRVFHPTAPGNLAAALAYGGHAIAVVLPGFAGLLGFATQPGGVVFAREISDRLRVVACLDKIPNMLHSDEPAWGGLPSEERMSLRRRVRMQDADAVILVWGSQEDVKTAVEEIDGRIREAFRGVPSETRQARAGGLSGFERILPGPNRMYPDTDLPLTRLDDERVERIRARLPELPWSREARYREQGLPEDVVRGLVLSHELAASHDRLVAQGHPPVLVGGLLVRVRKALRREGRAVERIGVETLEPMLAALRDGRIHREALPGLLRRVASGEAVATFPAPLGTEERDALVRRACEEARDRTFGTAGARHRWIMGRIMREASGRLSGRDLARRVDQEA
jgi:glutamyl-tRNA(Gln) amidotransferase subunit E